MNVKNLKCLEIGMSRAAGAIRVVRSRSRPLVAQRKALTFTPAAIQRLKVKSTTRFFVDLNFKPTKVIQLTLKYVQ